jgi:hypothetical protein
METTDPNEKGKLITSSMYHTLMSSYLSAIDQSTAPFADVERIFDRIISRNAVRPHPLSYALLLKSVVAQSDTVSRKSHLHELCESVVRIIAAINEMADNQFHENYSNSSNRISVMRLSQASIPVDDSHMDKVCNYNTCARFACADNQMIDMTPLIDNPTITKDSVTAELVTALLSSLTLNRGTNKIFLLNYNSS